MQTAAASQHEGRASGRVTALADAAGGDPEEIVSAAFVHVANDGTTAVVPVIEGPAGDPTCSDGLDNDGDQAIDLDDPDCAGPVTTTTTSTTLEATTTTVPTTTTVAPPTTTVPTTTTTTVGPTTTTVPTTTTTSLEPTTSTSTTSSTTTVPAPSTTTTTLPGGCDTGATFDSIACRLAALLATVDGTPELENLGPSLRIHLEIAQQRLDAAEGRVDADRGDSARGRLRVVEVQLDAFAREVDSPRARRLAPASVRIALVAAAEAIAADTVTLRSTL